MEQQKDKILLESIGSFLRRSVTLKLVSIFFLMVILMIPMSFVESLIHEREDLRQSAIKEVSNKWANEQRVYGPILTIPINKRVLDNDKVKVIREEAHILPSFLNINGRVEPQSLHRGIYEVVVYDSKLSFSGSFTNTKKYLEDLNDYEVLWDEAFLTINISDLRGIKENVSFNWNNESVSVEPGTKTSIAPSGITINNIFTSAPVVNDFNFSFELNLQGSGHLGFIPLGKETNVKLNSPWQDPSFSGSFLPDTRTVNKDGFNASYKILELNRNYPQFWIGEQNLVGLNSSSFGVDLLLPANDYQKSIRSAKYALLAIVLTFLTFFLVEIFSKKEVHPFQYVLIGLALCLFYTLLVSISEQVNFDLAYVIASLYIITMIGLYAKSFFNNIKQTLMLVVVLSFTYVFVYITLQLQDYALLIGSIGLTLILGFTMYITRKINWYDLSSLKKSES